MDVLTLAREHAFKAAEADPERVAALEAKRQWLDAKAGQVYAAIQPLAGQLVSYQGKQCRLQVSRRGDRAELSLIERVQFQTGEGEIRMKDGTKQIAKAMGCGVHDGYLWAPFNGAEKRVAQIEDLVKHVAGEVGPLLLVEKE